MISSRDRLLNFMIFSTVWCILRVTMKDHWNSQFLPHRLIDQFRDFFFPWSIDKFPGLIGEFHGFFLWQINKIHSFFFCIWLKNFAIFSCDLQTNFTIFFHDQLTNFAMFYWDIGKSLTRDILTKFTNFIFFFFQRPIYDFVMSCPWPIDKLCYLSHGLTN